MGTQARTKPTTKWMLISFDVAFYSLYTLIVLVLPVKSNANCLQS